MSRRVRFGPCLALLWAQAAAADAARAEPARVVLETASPAGSTARRLKAELGALGLEVEVVAPIPDDLDPLGPRGAARNRGALAVVLLRADDSGAVVWARRPSTGEVTVREIVTEPGSQSSIDDAIAIGATELLRADLMQLPIPREAEPTAPAPSAAAQGSEAHARRLALGAGPGVALAGPGLGAVPHATLDARIEATRWLDVQALASLGLRGSSVEDGTSSADVDASVFGGGLVAGEGMLRGSFWPSAGVGAMVARVEAVGHTTLPAFTRTEVAWVTAPYAVAGLLWRATDSVGLRAQGLVAVSPRPPAVRVLGDTVTRWGMPLVLGVLTIELAVGL